VETKRSTAAGQVFAWLYLIWLVWYLTPPARRKLWAMRAADQLRTLSRRAAVAHARYAMMQELQGDLDGAARAYQTAYQLMANVHDRAARWYEHARGAIL